VTPESEMIYFGVKSSLSTTKDGRILK